MNIYSHNGQFIDNKYTCIYYQIIVNALNQNRKLVKKDNINYIYYERHHILPRSVFPMYADLRLNKWNSVLLTAKEHFIVHALLVRMTSGVSKIKLAWALNMMCTTRSNIKFKSSLLYVKNKETLKKTEESRLKTVGERNGFYGKTHSDEIKAHWSSLRKGKQLSDEHRQKISKNNSRVNLGKPLGEETKNKLRIKAKARLANPTDHPCFGKKLSQETKDKIRVKATGRKHSDEDKIKRSNRMKGSGNPCYGTTYMWINDGIKNKRHNKDELIPENFVKGKIQKSKLV
jgi:hypothetical protein